MSIPHLILFGAALLVGHAIWRGLRRRAGRRYIDDYVFHEAIERKLAAKRPGLSPEQRALVLRGLRDWFWMCSKAGRRRRVSMPSQVVDDAWHEFILFTRAYEQFCRQTLGHFLHHTPAEAMSTPTIAQTGIKRAWRLACAREGLDPRHPGRLPLIFALDGLLGIEDGFSYSLDCQDPNSPQYGSGYCASHIGCGSGCAGDSGGHGCSGDGDGGGGCGGD